MKMARMLCLTALLATAPRAAAQSWTADDVHAASATARHSREIACIFRAEVGGVGFNPHAVHNDPANEGPGGLRAPNGLRAEFYARGGSDHFSPYQVANYLDSVLDEGRLSPWPYLRSWLASGRC